MQFVTLFSLSHCVLHFTWLSNMCFCVCFIGDWPKPRPVGMATLCQSLEFGEQKSLSQRWVEGSQGVPGGNRSGRSLALYVASLRECKVLGSVCDSCPHRGPLFHAFPGYNRQKDLDEHLDIGPRYVTLSMLRGITRSKHREDITGHR